MYATSPPPPPHRTPNRPSTKAVIRRSYTFFFESEDDSGHSERDVGKFHVVGRYSHENGPSACMHRRGKLKLRSMLYGQEGICRS